MNGITIKKTVVERKTVSSRDFKKKKSRKGSYYFTNGPVNTGVKADNQRSLGEGTRRDTVNK